MKRKTPKDRAREFGFAKAEKFAPPDEGEKRSTVQFWKWYGYLYGACYGWYAGYRAGRRAGNS